jgi:hypothetical protein
MAASVVRGMGNKQDKRRQGEVMKGFKVKVRVTARVRVKGRVRVRVRVRG